MTGGADAEPCPPDSMPERGRGCSDISGPRVKGCRHTLCDENVRLPCLHGKERLVDGIDLNEDEGPGGFARPAVVVSHELDPATQVLTKGKPDRLDAILECQFEQGDVRRLPLFQLPPEKPGADGEWPRRPIQRRPCDVEFVPEFLDPCVD